MPPARRRAHKEEACPVCRKICGRLRRADGKNGRSDAGDNDPLFKISAADKCLLIFVLSPVDQYGALEKRSIALYSIAGDLQKASVYQPKSKRSMKEVQLMRIELKQIDENNFLDAFDLKLGEGQEKFVSHPIRSLAQAYVYYKQCTPFGIYSNDKMVGYVMVIYDYDASEYNIWHMMIDKAEQGKGYGKAALIKVLEYIRSKPFGGSDRVVLTCSRDNKAAMSLYRSIGFTLTGNSDEEEDELALTLQ